MKMTTRTKGAKRGTLIFPKLKSLILYQGVGGVDSIPPSKPGQAKVLIRAATIIKKPLPVIT